MKDVVMFKRIKVIGLTLVGLLAMLGTQAEAHYMYVDGRYYYHSVGCGVTIGSVPTPPDPFAVTCAVVTTQVETLCPGGSIVGALLQVNVSAQVLDPGETEVDVLVDDAPLLDGDVNNACGGSDPTDVLIREMATTVTISKCVSLVGDPCSVLLLTSTAVATCELSEDYDLEDYPDNLPEVGTDYTCTDPPTIVHVN